MRDRVLLFLNGVQRQVSGEDAFLPLSTWLREREHATGTKIVCEEGDCGACTVLVGRPHEGKLRYLPINSCIQFVAQFDGAHVVTVEGVGDMNALSAVQQRLVDHNGTQCGFCTPGFVMSLTALAEERTEWNESDAREALTGNLCRCTGYISIIEAAMAVRGEDHRRIEARFPSAAITRSLEQATRESLAIESGTRRFLAPTSLDEALHLKNEIADLVIVQGATDIGVAANKRAFAPATLMTLARIPELDAIETIDRVMSIGTNATLAQLAAHVSSSLPELQELLVRFGSPQIRNAGTVVGNVANGSPIGDLLPFLFTSNATIAARSLRGERHVPITQLYSGYKTMTLAADELITRIDVPLPANNEILRLYKVSNRRDLDISSFSAAVRMAIAGGVMSDVRIAFGGVAATCVRLRGIEAMLENQPIAEELFVRAGEIAQNEVAPISDVRGSREFRTQLAGNILMKLYFDLQERARGAA